jgi:hypothetical protein
MRSTFVQLGYSVGLTAVLMLFGNGCASLLSGTAFSGQSNRVDQSQEMDYAPPLKMKIVRAYWGTEASAYGGTTPQGKSLIIELALTNYGNSPLKPINPPILKLSDATGRTFDPRNPNNFTTGIIFGGPINPGSASQDKVIFDVPPGTYDLVVDVGSVGVGWTLTKGRTAFIWILNPSPQQ